MDLNSELKRLKKENQELKIALQAKQKTDSRKYYHIKIRNERVKKGIKQEQICKFLGVTQGNYTRIESGKTKMTVETLIKICHFLKIDLENIFKAI